VAAIAGQFFDFGVPPTTGSQSDSGQESTDTLPSDNLPSQ